MPMIQLLSAVAVLHVAPDATAAATFALAAGTSGVNSSAIDAGTGEAIAIAVTLGAIVATGTGSLKLQHADAEAGPWTDVPNTTVAYTDAAADKMVAWEIQRPLKRYVRVATARATANSAVASIHAYRIGARKLPVGQSLAAGQFASPPIVLASPQ